jgi:hypothetical protein
MQASSNTSKSALSVRSKTFPPERIGSILNTPGIYHCQGHFEYPVSESGKAGNHLDALFLIEPIVHNPQFVDWIVQDISEWMSAEGIDCDLIFAPQQATVKAIVEKLAKVSDLPIAYWKTSPNGWFGDALASGQVKTGSKALAFNAVSLTGRCIGERLPSFLQELGGEAVASAAFAIGTTDGANRSKERFQRRLYAGIDVPLHLYAPTDCPICVDSAGVRMKLTPWTAVRDQITSGR